MNLATSTRPARATHIPSAWRAALLAGLIVCGAWPVAAADVVTEQVQVTGDVKTPLTLKVDDLKAFPAEQITRLTVTRRVGDKDVSSTVRGVRLTAVLERAALAGDDRMTWRRTVVLASASDGYRVVFSWPELFNTDVGPGVIVVFERDGQALSDREGRIALVSGNDQRGGPRSVKWLSRLDVKILKD